MKCLQCGAGVTGDFCAYCKTATRHTSHKAQTTTKTNQNTSTAGGSNQSKQTNQQANLIESYNQQIQKIKTMMIPDNVKELKINVIKKKIAALNA